jgi:transposase InsO family protein
VALPKVADFSEIITLDLKQFGEIYVLWMICSFTRFCQGVVLKDKTALSIVEAINSGWNWRFGFPSVGFWADNGSEFLNHELNEYASKFGFVVNFGPTYSPWSNGINERNHYSADVTVKKIMEVDRKLTLKKAVEMAAWTHNTNTNILGYDPLSLVTGKSVFFPGILTGNVATESMFDSEAIKKIMERHHEITKKFREVEYGSKLERASKQQNRKFNNVK